MFQLSKQSRIALLIFAAIAFFGPNAVFLYYAFTQPALIQEANANPIALAFMIEAMMLMALFLVYLWFKTKSLGQVVLYLILTFIGSLAFSFVVFLYAYSKPKTVVTR